MYKNKEKLIGDFYNQWSEQISKNDFIKKTLAHHYGYHTKGIRTLKDALINMNEYVAELLQLENKKDIKILDAGCGIGGTSIYFSKKYPDVSFMGITIASHQVKLAKKFAEAQNISNAKFIYGNYLNTEFKNNTFDGIFALESSQYATNHKAFLDEMYRILKPGGRFVVVDGFRTPRPLNPIMKKIYQRFCYDFGYVNLAIISEYKRYLEEKGFTEIFIKDISKNVQLSVFLIGVVTLPDFSFKIFKKKIFPLIDNNQNNDFSYQFHGNTIWAGICGLCKVIRYYGIYSVKK
jgi:ubiquinone/menaquinone biosynthesis C-methylase UbiE